MWKTVPEVHASQEFVEKLKEEEKTAKRGKKQGKNQNKPEGGLKGYV